jgi:hypothetical protein
MFLKIKSFFKSRIFKRILLLMGSCIIAFLLGEITVYFLYKEKIVLFPRYVTDAQYNDFQIRRNLPDHSYKHTSFDGKWEFKINSQGFRDIRDFKYEKPKEVLRVLVLGDSFTIGYEVRQNQTYSAVLEAYLKRKGIQAEVINAGMSGNSNAEELIFYEQEGVRYQPDIIILGFYHNDLEDNLRSNLYSLKEGQLLVKNKTYLPGIKIGNFLNRFSLYRFLNENSYLVNFINMGITAKIK